MLRKRDSHVTPDAAACAADWACTDDDSEDEHQDTFPAMPALPVTRKALRQQSLPVTRKALRQPLPVEFPAMPVTLSPQQPHREKIEDINDPKAFYACVARDVPHWERRQNPKAEASVAAEWTKLRTAGSKGCWDEAAVREYDDLKAEISTSGRKVHFGYVMELCVEKNYDIPGKQSSKVDSYSVAMTSVTKRANTQSSRTWHRAPPH